MVCIRFTPIFIAVYNQERLILDTIYVLYKEILLQNPRFITKSWLEWRMYSISNMRPIFSEPAQSVSALRRRQRRRRCVFRGGDRLSTRFDASEMRQNVPDLLVRSLWGRFSKLRSSIHYGCFCMVLSKNYEALFYYK